MNYPSTLPNAIIPFQQTELGDVVTTGYRGRAVLSSRIDFPVYKATLVYPKLPWASYLDLQEFFYNRKGGSLPFTFQCPIGHDASSLTIARVPEWRRLYVGVGDGAEDTFDLPLKGFTGVEGTHFHIYVNSVEIDPSNYTILYNPGRDGRAQVQFDAGFEPGAGLVVTVSGKFQRTIDAIFGKNELVRPVSTSYVILNVSVDILEVRLDA